MKVSARRIISAFLSVSLFVMSIFPTAITSFAAHTAVGRLIDGNTDPAFSIVGADEDGTVNITINGTPISELGSDYRVSEGAAVALDFSWTLANGYLDETDEQFTIKYDLSSQMNGIKLLDHSYPVDVENVISARYTIEDNVLYIDVTYHLSQNIKGAGVLKGNISMEKADNLQDGKFTFKFFETEKDLTFAGIAPELIVSKSAGNIVYEGGEYYVDYKVEVSNSGYDDALNVNLTDTFLDTHGLFDNTFYGMTITYPDGTVGNPAFSNGDTINIGTVQARSAYGAGGTPTVITYRIKMDPDVAADKTIKYNTKNTVTVQDNDGHEAYAEAQPNIYAPDISKSGSYNNDKTDPKITWTITVNPSFYGKKDDVDFFVVDIPGENLTADEVYNAINADHPGCVHNNGGELTIDKEAFDRVGNNYILTYKTTVSDEIATSDTRKYIKNNTKATIEGKEYTDSETTVTIGGLDALKFVDKNFVSIDGNDITWEVEVTIPATTETVSNVTFQDYTSGTNSAVHTINFDTVTLVGGNIDDVGYWDYKNADGKSCQFHIYDEYADAHKGETLKFRYVTTIQDSMDETYYNHINANAKVGTDTINDQASAEYSRDFEVVKEPSTAWALTLEDPIYHPLQWAVFINTSNIFEYKKDDVIEVVDLLPKGYKLASNVRYGMNRYGATDYEAAYTTKMVGERQQITIRIPLDADQVSLANNTNSIGIHYATGMTPEYETDFAKLDQGSYPFKNEATVKVAGNNAGSVECTQNVENDSKHILDKSVTSTYEADNKYYANYKININEHALTLVPESRITAVDKLGSRLKLDEDSVTIYPEMPGDSHTYNKTSNTLTFDLSDGVAYTVTYRAEVLKIYKNDKYSEDKLSEFFGNTVSLTGNGEEFGEEPHMLLDSQFRTDYSASSDDGTMHIKFSGEKTWSDVGKEGIRPKSIKIKLKQHKFNSAGEAVPADDTEITEEVTLLTSTGKWHYETKELTVKDTAGNTYEYDVEEVEIDGYKAEYTYNGTTQTDPIKGFKSSTNKTFDIAIMNTFTAETEEVGYIEVNKGWVGDTADTSHRCDVTFVLTDADGTELESKTLNVGDTENVKFGPYPLYTYGRDADDNLTRTPREYKIYETGLNDYYTTDAPATAPKQVFIVDDGSTKGVPSSDIVRPVDITNSYGHNDYITISGNKTFSDAGYEDLRPDSVTLKLIQYKDSGTGFDAGTELTDKIIINLNKTDSSFAYTSGSLIIKDDQNAIYKYDLVEDTPDGYVTVYTVGNGAEASTAAGITGNDKENITVNIKNTFTDNALGSVKLNKTWDDDNDARGLRPATVKFTLYDVTAAGKPVKKETKTLTVSGTGDSVTFTGLPVYAYSRESDGSITKTLKKYSIVEDDVEKYAASALGNFTLVEEGASDLTFPVTAPVAMTNTYSDNEYIRIKGTKTFSDEGYKSLRPDSVKLKLIQYKDSGAGFDTGTELSNKIVIDVSGTGDSFGYISDRLIVLEEDGTKYKYDLIEEAIDGYDVLYTVGSVTSASAEGITGSDNEQITVDIRNTVNITEVYGNVKLTKTWDDDNNAHNARADVTFSLYDISTGNDILVGTETLAADSTDNSVTFTHLPVFIYERDDNGNIVKILREYKIVENEIDKYVSSFDSETFRLVDSADDIVLPITKEVGVTNTYSSDDFIKIKARKIFADSGYESARPQSITLGIKQYKDSGSGFDAGTLLNDKIVINVNADNSSFAFASKKLIVRDESNTVYKYDLIEETPDGYTTVYTIDGEDSASAVGITGNDGDDIVVDVTNTFEDYTGSLTINKTWDDDNDESGRADAVFDLYNTAVSDTVPYKTLTITKGEASASVSGLPLFTYSRAAGGALTRTPITYTLSEREVSGYTTTIAAADSSFRLVTSSAVPTGAVTKTVSVTNKKKTTPVVTDPTETSATTTSATTPDHPSPNDPPRTTATTAVTPGPAVTAAPSPTPGTVGTTGRTTSETTRKTTSATTEPDEIYDIDEPTTTPPEDEEEPEPDYEEELVNDDDSNETVVIDETPIEDEANPNTGTKLPTLFASALFGVIALIPSRKKKQK